jgi:isoleucyl-tRNA synthetase
VREVRFLAGTESLVTLRAQPNFRVLGKRFGGRTKAVAEAIRALPSERLAAFRRGETLAVKADGALAELDAEEFEIVEEAGGELLVESDGGYTVALDTHVDEELRVEGLARELINRIQRVRREAGLHVSDRIGVHVRAADEAVLGAVRRHRDFIAGETLAVSLEAGPAPAPLAHGGTTHDVDLDGSAVSITLWRVEA